jgi:hypothetical protein
VTDTDAAFVVLQRTLERIAESIEAANKERIAPDSEVVRVRVGIVESYNGYHVRAVSFMGGKSTGGPNPRRVLVAALGKVEPGEYLVRIRPFDPADASTWDWHDWRKL